jgi:micrococcal nuclease
LTDAEIDRAVGDQVRSGAFFVDTRAIPDRPLCSGLTLAQAIQNIRAAAHPEEQAQAEARRAALIAAERARPAIPAAVEHDADAPPARAVRRVPAVAARRHFAAPRRSPARSFGSCREARAAGAAPLRRGDPGYSGRLDRDGDGVACE